jgi:hypothetical protein
MSAAARAPPGEALRPYAAGRAHHRQPYQNVM